MSGKVLAGWWPNPALSPVGLKTSARAVIVALCGWHTGPAHAQSSDNPILDASGFQQNRDYFNDVSFEHIDTLSGNVILTFTDLVLPGNAGRDLRFQRTYKR